MDTTVMFTAYLDSWGLLLLLFATYTGASVWIFTWFDIERSVFRRDSDKIGWKQLVTYLPLLGAIIYLAIGRNQKIA